MGTEKSATENSGLESLESHLDAVTVPLVLTSPHAGEWVPPEAVWLHSFSESLLLTDVDRFIDDLFLPGVLKWKIPRVITRVHRYACDLNRIPEDVDLSTVTGAVLPKGTHSTGLHWHHTMNGAVLIENPISRALHGEIVEKYFYPFHQRIEAFRERLSARFPNKPLYHLDCHSMPSVPTSMHADLGKGLRAEVVLSDREGKSCSPGYRRIVNDAFLAEGFQAVWNHPYKGGRITQRYGKPDMNSEAIQIELRRDLYMDEKTFVRLPGKYEALKERLEKVMSRIIPELEMLSQTARLIPKNSAE